VNRLTFSFQTYTPKTVSAPIEENLPCTAAFSQQINTTGVGQNIHEDKQTFFVLRLATPFV
jgi:hypothetical protein